MNQVSIPTNVQSLISDAIDSVGSLEVLLLLYHEPHREWACDQVASALRIEPDWTRRQMKHLAKRGLVCVSGNRSQCFRYYPATMDLNAAVAELARTYAVRPLSVISFIHSRPAAALRRFANAFRVRRDADEVE